jgi:adenylate kinase
VEHGTAIGKEAAALMKEGKMVPSRIVLGLLRKSIEENIDSNGFLIDGYPRAMDQAIEFENTV